MRTLVVPDGRKPPAGIQCLHCRKVARPGDVILLHTIHNVGYFLLHKACVLAIMEEAPLDSYENLQAKMAEGKPLFD